MPLSDRRKAMIQRVTEAYHKGDHVSTRDCKEFLSATEDVDWLLRAFGDRYLLVSTDLMFMRQMLDSWVDARSRS